MPKVSIVLPTYNGEKYIRESIDSILCQNFEDWELIIVDDCSTDHTPEIIDGYAGKDGRIKVIHNRVNQKLPEALNVGFREAVGECLTWTSDDNRYMQNAIREMYSKLTDNEEVKMVCADMKLIDMEGEIRGKCLPYEEERMLYENCVGACFMYKREVLEQVGDYDSGMFCVEDYDYWLRVLVRFGKIEHIAKCLYLYRQHEDSLTFTKKEKIWLQLLKLREKYQEFIFGHLYKNREMTCSMYYDFLEGGRDRNYFVEKANEWIPELACEKKTIKESDRYVIFGAGKIGESAFKDLKGKVIFFVDNDKGKCGKTKCGLPIRDVSALKENKMDYVIMVAVFKNYLYPILHQLYEEKIFNYITYPYYKMVMERGRMETIDG